MIDYSKDMVAALSTILPTHYELRLSTGTQTPCISYQERNNSADINGDTLGYSRLAYTVKVWGNDIAALNNYAIQIDSVLRPLGWKRTNSGELYDMNSTMIQKILTYEAYAIELF